MELWMLGGDRRSPWAAQTLRSAGHAVHTFCVPSLPDETPPPEIERLILPMPCLRNGAIPGTRPLAPQEVLAHLRAGSRVYGGLLDRLGLPEGIRAAELYGSEPMTTRNAVATAEGAIAEAVLHSDGTLHGAACLVIGFGRVGLALAQRLHGLSAHVTVAARRVEVRAQAEALGFRSDEIGVYAHGTDYSYVFNTVPAPVLPVCRMACLPPDCLLMELASAPGGYEQAAAKRLGLRTVTAPGLPARCCPQEAGDAYGQAILNVLEEDP